MKADIITPEEAKTLPGLFNERLRRSPGDLAYRYYKNEVWHDLTWQQMDAEIKRWQAALCNEQLDKGDRVAIMLSNCPYWVVYDQAALRTGLVTVPLYTNDRADNIGYIINDANVKIMLIVGDEHWELIKTAYEQLDNLQRIITINQVKHATDKRLISLHDWLQQAEGTAITEPELGKDELATIVYTSGTTGKPKGVMLSHHNIIWDAHAGTQSIPCYPGEIFLSFLPLSHTLERSIGYYFAMMCNSPVAYARSIDDLAEDLTTIKPNVLISVPRIFERVYNKIQLGLAEKPAMARNLFTRAVDVGWHRFEYQQGRTSWHPKLLLWPVLNALVAKKVLTKLGGRIRFAISGGAPLSEEIAKTFIGLGLTIAQGYGLTETSPVISVNKLANNLPATVGEPLHGVETMVSTEDELLARGPMVMLGYWNNEAASKEIIDENGWLHTGDKVKFVDGHILITGRLKDIIVMSNGEKVPPADIEMAITNNALFEQAMVIGEGKPYLSAIVVVDYERCKLLFGKNDVDSCLHDEDSQQRILDQIKQQLTSFPGYANIYRVHATLEPWTIDEELITPTLKLKRSKIMEKYKKEIDKFYVGH